MTTLDDRILYRASDLNFLFPTQALDVLVAFALHEEVMFFDLAVSVAVCEVSESGFKSVSRIKQEENNC